MAWELARRGHGVLAVESERQPGTHASSQNAAMIRAIPLEEELVGYCFEGTKAWNRLPAELDRPGMFRRVGSLLLAEEDETLALIERRVAQAKAAGLNAEVWPREAVVERLPCLADTPMRAAAYCADDGVADPVGLVEALLDAAQRNGAEICYDATLTELRECGDTVECTVSTPEGALAGRLRARSVVVAAGAWAPELLRRSGLGDHGLVPHRRHLFCTVPEAPVDRDAPFVWHLDRHVYFRPEAGGLLFSVCDESPSSAGRPALDPGIDEFCERRLMGVFDFLLEQPIRSAWAGLRTFNVRHGFVLGRARGARRIHLAAGLGGHGVTAALAVGRCVAEGIEAEHLCVDVGNALARADEPSEGVAGER